ncbi:MAG: MFS transporter [Bacteroidetes bacterium]|nr:MFS transporter [Bacteroidota bacterium]PWI46237.1 MAG: MFS transporter [Candidatus Heimdallarchaeota archaeon B3_Heim]
MTNQINSKRLFFASCIALIVTAISFALRARLETVFGPEGYGLTLEEIGWAFGPAFWGFTLAMFIGGPLVDYLGIKRIIWTAFICHTLGITGTILAHDFWTLFFGTLAIGIGNGMVEASLNPMVASMFPNEKIKMLNRFHVWWPAGIVIGAIIGYLIMDKLNLNWHVYVAMLFIPLVIYGVMFFGQKIPQTERVEMGVSNKDMWKAVITPLFLLMAFLMLLTAATELGTNQRIESLLKGTGVSALLVLAFISGIMAIGRVFAGPIVAKLSTRGMLFFSAIFSFLGLIWLSYAQGYSTFIAAAVFAIGICYFWPTMIGFVSENIPESGALGLSLMGGLGFLSAAIVLPLMGKFMDMTGSGVETLRYMAILPALLIIAFGLLYITHKKKSRT